MRHHTILTLPLLLLVACTSPGSSNLPIDTTAPTTSAAPPETPQQTAARLSVLAAHANRFKVKVYGNGNPPLRAALAQRPLELRDQTLILADGNHLYSNNDQALRELQQYVQLEDGSWINQDGFKIDLPPSDPEPQKTPISAQNNSPTCPTTNTGPFIRHISPIGYSKFHGDVYLPVSSNAAQNRKAGTKENIYLYSGGWGATGTAIDAGFQRNDTTRYQGLLKVETSKAPSDSQFGGYAIGTSPQFTEGQTGSIDFFSFNDTSVHATMYGKDSTGTYTSVSFQFNSLAGFSETGTGMEVKFTTSVGQRDAASGNLKDDFTTGAYVNTQWSGMTAGNANLTKAWTQTSGLSAKTCLYPSAYATGSWLNSTTYQTIIQLPYVNP